MTRWIKAGEVSKLDPEYPTVAKIGEVEVAICRAEGEVFAVHNICTHAYARLSDGWVEGHEILCPLHQGSFDLRTGDAVRSPCHDPIPVFQVRVEGDDILLDNEEVARFIPS
jgi:nitrite reductase/ring-hydroxylating ferredoxin subunit